jgi:hypothetical protein
VWCHVCVLIRYDGNVYSCVYMFHVQTHKQATNIIQNDPLLLSLHNSHFRTVEPERNEYSDLLLFKNPTLEFFFDRFQIGTMSDRTITGRHKFLHMCMKLGFFLRGEIDRESIGRMLDVTMGCGSAKRSLSYDRYCNTLMLLSSRLYKSDLYWGHRQSHAHEGNTQTQTRTPTSSSYYYSSTRSTTSSARPPYCPPEKKGNLDALGCFRQLLDVMSSARRDIAIKEGDRFQTVNVPQADFRTQQGLWEVPDAADREALRRRQQNMHRNINTSSGSRLQSRFRQTTPTPVASIGRESSEDAVGSESGDSVQQNRGEVGSRMTRGKYAFGSSFDPLDASQEEPVPGEEEGDSPSIRDRLILTEEDRERVRARLYAPPKKKESEPPLNSYLITQLAGKKHSRKSRGKSVKRPQSGGHTYMARVASSSWERASKKTKKKGKIPLGKPNHSSRAALVSRASRSSLMPPSSMPSTPDATRGKKEPRREKEQRQASKVIPQQQVLSLPLNAQQRAATSRWAARMSVSNMYRPASIPGYKSTRDPLSPYAQSLPRGMPKNASCTYVGCVCVWCIIAILCIIDSFVCM